MPTLALAASPAGGAKREVKMLACSPSARSLTSLWRAAIFCVAKGRSVSATRPVNLADAPTRHQRGPVDLLVAGAQIANPLLPAPDLIQSFPNRPEPRVGRHDILVSNRTYHILAENKSTYSILSTS
jgi:hypothetical protein